MLAVMSATPQHTYLALTKRGEAMRTYMSEPTRAATIYNGQIAPPISLPPIPWPLPNLWLGVSVENQALAAERITPLLQTPAAIRWLSAEPLLGPLDISDYLRVPLAEGASWRECQCAEIHPSDRPCMPCMGQMGLDWVVVGGESGPKARPMHPAWATTLLRQCNIMNVPFFFKQWGEYLGLYGRQDGKNGIGFTSPIPLKDFATIRKWDGEFPRTYAKDEVTARSCRRARPIPCASQVAAAWS
jgi:protein gp37